MDFSHTKITLRRSIWSYSKIQRGVRALHSYLYGIPDLRWGIVRNISKKRGQIFCDYISNQNQGLYSILSTTLDDILRLARNGIYVDRIDYSQSMHFFKGQVGKDVFPDFFKELRFDISDIPNELMFDAFDVHKIYKHLPLADLSRAASIFFHPSSSVVNTVNELVRSSGVIPERSIAVIYRGTDKSSEIKLAPVEDYIRAIDFILCDSDNDLSVIIQTDQQQVRDQVLAYFGKKCHFFSQLPATRGSTALHQLDFGKEIMMSREEFAKRMMGAALILSRCAYVITYTGNVGAWIAIYRGTSKNIYQFDASAQLQMP